MIASLKAIFQSGAAQYTKCGRRFQFVFFQPV